MTTYTFTGAVAYDRPGSSWRTAAGLRSVSVTDPATGLLPTNLVQGGVAVTWLTADANSRYSFECDVPGVVVDFGAGAEALYANEVPGLAIAAGVVNDSAIATIVGNPASATSVSLGSTYDRKRVFNVKTYGATGDGVTDDTAAIVAAMTAAHNSTAWNTPIAVVWFPFGTFLTDPINFDGYQVTPLGEGPQSTTIKAKPTNADYLMTFPSGWLGKGVQNLWRTSIGGFRLQGSGAVASTAFIPGPTAQALNGGMRIDVSSVYLHDVMIRETGGPCLYLANAQLSWYSNVILNRPIGADTNAVPYLYSVGYTNQSVFEDMLFQAGSSDGNDGPAVVWIDQDAAYGSINQAHWQDIHFEYMKTPPGGAIWDTRSSTTTYADSKYEDCTGGAGSSYMIFRGTGASGGQGAGNLVTGFIPGALGGYARGILLQQSGNAVDGVGTSTNHVEFAAGVNYNTASIKGVPIGATAVVDNSGTTTNVIVNPASYASVARTNLTINPNMETNITNWTAAGGAAPATITQDTTIFHSGAASLKAVCSGALVYQGVISTPSVMATLVVGATYTVSAWVYSTVAGNVRVGLTSTTPAVLQTAVLANTWTRVSYTGVCNSASLPQVLIDSGNVARATTLYIDDVLVERANSVGAYFAGSTAQTLTAAHLWTGVVGGSTSREIAPVSTAAAITTPTAPSAAYVQAEAAAAKTAIDAILATLKANGLSA